MNRLVAISILALSLGAGCTVSYAVSASAYVRPSAGIRVSSPPPPLRAEVERPAKPSEAAVWVAGHWDWQDGWVWVPGAWFEPQPGYVYEPPTCVEVNGGIDYYPGYFHPAGEAPPAAYQEPSTIPVYIRPPGAPAPTVDVATQPADANAHAANPTQQAGTVTVDVDGAHASQGGATVNATSNGANVTQQAGTVNATSNGANVTQQAGTVNATSNGANVTQQAGTVNATSNDANVTQQAARLPLRCSVVGTRAVRGGLVTLRGQGFAQGVTVRIGGRVAPVEDVTPARVTARMPGTSRGGAVSVQLGDARADCGRVLLTGG